MTWLVVGEDQLVGIGLLKSEIGISLGNGPRPFPQVGGRMIGGLYPVGEPIERRRAGGGEQGVLVFKLTVERGGRPTHFRSDGAQRGPVQSMSAELTFRDRAYAGTDLTDLIFGERRGHGPCHTKHC